MNQNGQQIGLRHVDHGSVPVTKPIEHTENFMFLSVD